MHRAEKSYLEAREWIDGQGETAPVDDSVEEKNRRRHREVFGTSATYTGKTFWPTDEDGNPKDET